MKRVTAMLLVMAILGPAVAIGHYDSCEGCIYTLQRSGNEYEIVFYCVIRDGSGRTSCEVTSTGCRFNASCATSFWV